ncbi:MAG: triose-phosphate isomerase [Crocinitomicaceae bacterium]|nr:triose-phosphate isomerase [Crocinitomicaceae bacterium]
MLVAGNWKSNKSFNEAQEFAHAFARFPKAPLGVEVMVAPPAPYLAALGTKGVPFLLGAQNVSSTGPGAQTGEFTADMLSGCGVTDVIVGHSERRDGHGDDDDRVAEKVNRVLDAGLRVVFCCGESLHDRQSDVHFDKVLRQLESGVLHLSAEVMSRVVVAYEPIWAIGTGLTATALQAQEMHAAIRQWLSEAYDTDIAKRIPLLYGGSCKPSNADELFACQDVDGGLIGGASLDPESFQALVEAAGRAVMNREKPKA